MGGTTTWKESVEALPAGLGMYDGLSPEQAVKAAWLNAGINPDYHADVLAKIREMAPILGRALDRLGSSK